MRDAWLYTPASKLFLPVGRRPQMSAPRFHPDSPGFDGTTWTDSVLHSTIGELPDCDLLAIPVFQKDETTLKATWAFRQLNELTGGELGKIVSRRQFAGGLDSTLGIDMTGDLPNRVLLVGLGKDAEFDDESVGPVAALATREAASYGLQHVVIASPLEKRFADSEPLARRAGAGAMLGAYTYDLHMTVKRPCSINTVTLLLNHPCDPEIEAQFSIGISEGAAQNIARDLVNGPPGLVTPDYLADVAGAIASRHEMLGIEVLNEDECRELNMGCFLSVNAGSVLPPRFIVISYRHPKAKRTIGLCGKGVTFDSGGQSLKPAEHMMDMKTDMAGGAAVLAVMDMIGSLEPEDINVFGIIAATDNQPGNTATDPGDVATAMNGTTVEILNTDAEGRLTLADAICYADTVLDCDAILSIATLTGAQVIATGNHYPTLFGSDREIAESLMFAAELAGEPGALLPWSLRDKKQLKSEIADLKNIGTKAGGSMTAALFCGAFTDKSYAHMDIAGPSAAEKPWGEFTTPGGTGWGMRTLLQFVLSQRD